MIARYNTKPAPVTIIHTGGVTQVTLALNPREHTTEAQEEIPAWSGWLVDFTRFTFTPGTPGAPDENAIRETPAAFLHLRGDLDALRKELTAAVQEWMDATARTHGYDSIFTACTYAASTDAVFRAEGQACVAWRDAVWKKANTLAADVLTGRINEIPEIDSILATLPGIEWPNL